MFIKEILKRNKGYNQIYKYYRLVESYRIGNNVRHRTILNLGRLYLTKEEQKLLADRIESIITGQEWILAISDKIKELANHYAQVLIHKKLGLIEEGKEIKCEYERVDINSIKSSEIRTVGAEYIGISTLRKLGLERLFKQLGFSDKEIKIAILSIVGSLVHTGSEKAIKEWSQNISGIDELLDTDFSHLSNNALYRIMDKILLVKEEIEKHLRKKEKFIFNLQEKIILYDLTNTYLEGSGNKNTKAKRGRSKDKRNDSPLVTLGLIIDELGFPKRSEIFRGNISEPETLKEMIEGLSENKDEKENTKDKNEKKYKTVVIDAGIATEDNVKMLRGEGYDYICVSRKRSYDFTDIGDDSFVTIKEKKDDKVEVKLKKGNNEQILFCRSFRKSKKEESIKTFFQKRFETGLKAISKSLNKKGGTKNYEKVLLRIGRLKEKNSPVAHYYRIDVKKEGKIATKITWSFELKEKAEERFAGTYYLRTSRMDLDEKDIWSIYIMLTEIEESFKILKMELKIRPVHHQKTSRTDAHIFLTLLAYHLLVSIKTELKKQEFTMRWERVKEIMSTHARVTTSMTNDKTKRIHIRSTSEPEDFHRAIYNALGLSGPDCKKKILYL